MQLVHQFTVPAPIDDAWKTLLDLPRVAPCMPGATLDEFDGEKFTGSVKVKLGPMTLLYRGQGRLAETDESAHRLVMEASGKDTRGSGTAAATVTASLTADGDRTQVNVTTDLKITGRPAQFGRGLISDVSGKLLDQFADCLAKTLGTTPAEAAATVSGAAVSGAAVSGAAVSGAAVSGAAVSAATGTPGETAAEPGLVGIGGSDGEDLTDVRAAAPGEPELGDRGSVEDAEADRAQVEVEPINLLEITGAQEALRRYGPYAGAAAAVLAAVFWVGLRRRRR
ncbi:SRPBCC family protein [Phytoactinopolyspora alkaliphila]|uniref:SRPBCC family protein n=1 Tax=Phytoactinopolyspora alkaliphila TaxID=1783498 RepID=A0A6N9YM74_9ACTN|nr:SRPBCC family protein [Phytoactinopolyspora alkaliphila]NED96161.1 SRPBCC family protein [Phytoactinopolyspora alkaliphila]